MGRTEATAFGVLMATIMGGTIWMLLASNPYVFNEDLAWSICLTVGSIFALLGVDRATVMGASDRQWPADLVCEPRPRNDGVGLCCRCRTHCSLVPARSRWTGEPAMVHPGVGSGPDPPGHRLHRQLRRSSASCSVSRTSSRSGPTSTPTDASFSPRTTTRRKARSSCRPTRHVPST